MGKTGWKIRFYETDDFTKTVDVVGNYERWGARYDDDIITFCGMYGIGDYLIWYMKKNVGVYDFGAINLDLSIYIDAKRIFQRQYVTRDVRYDTRTSRYVLYAISKDTQILNTPLIDYDISSLSYSKDRTVEQVLRDVLEVNNILKVQFDEHPLKSVDFQYRQLTFNIRDNVYDFIRYIADDSSLEWFVRNKVLYIGKELHIRKKMRSANKIEDITENISESSIFKKVSGTSRPMDVLSHLEETWKCVWAKHAAGKCGGLSKGCFTKRGSGQINKKAYYQSLEGKIEKGLGSKLLERNPHIYASSYVSIGNILKDEGDVFIDEVSIQRNANSLNVRTPTDVKIDRNDGGLDTIVQHMKEQVSRSTPYADVDAGLFFPVPKLTSAPPNVLIHNVDGREEASVIGNYILGNGRDISLPIKGKGDFRLQFPNGWCLYVKENGDTILQVKDTAPGTIPDEVSTVEGFMFKITDDDSEFRLVLDDSNLITVINKEHSMIFQSDGQIFMKGSKGIKLFGDDTPNNYINIGKGDEDNITISSGSKDIVIQTTGGGNITIDGLTIKIQGGGNKLSHGDHTHGYSHIHSTGNIGMPIPIQTHVPGVTVITDQHLPIQGTTTTEAE